MNVLPWLVIHGAAVWQASLAIFLLGGLAFASIRPRLAARRASRAARERLGWPVRVSETRRGARVTLTGRLDAEDPCQRYEDGAEAAAVSGAGAGGRAGRLVLDVGYTTVWLDGPIELLAGSREAWPGRLPAAIRRRLPHDAPAAAGAPVFRSLASGDRIRVSGVLSEEASDEAPSYRDAAKRWTLGGGLVAAFDGKPRVTGPGALVRLPHVIGAGLLFLGVFGGGGEAAMALAAKELTVYASTPEGGGLGAVLAAASTPFRRGDALDALVGALDARRDPDPEVLAARAALHELRGERETAAAMWIAHGEPERGARLAEAEGSFALAARGWYAAGEFERAADAWERSGEAADEHQLRFGLGVQLFARRLDRAAGTARRLAAMLQAHAAGSDELRTWYAARADMVSCLADALHARHGDAATRKALHEGRPGPILPACALLRIDLVDGSDRVDAIRALPALTRGTYDVPLEWLDLLAAEADAGRAADTPVPFDSAAEILAIPNGEPLWRMVPAVERRIAEALANGAPQTVCVPGIRPCHVVPRRTRTRATAAAAMFASLAGDDPGAKHLARAAQDAFEPLARGGMILMEGDPSDPAEVAAVTALPGDMRPAEQLVPRARGEFLHGLLDFVEDHDARAILHAMTRTPPPDEDEKQAWSLAAAGDGEGLARWLRRPRSQPGTFLRLGTQQLRTGRADVMRWIRWGYRPPSAFRPTEEVVHLASLAAAAEAIEPSGTARLLRERAARFRQAILRRETAVPLAVLERL